MWPLPDFNPSTRGENKCRRINQITMNKTNITPKIKVWKNTKEMSKLYGISERCLQAVAKWLELGDEQYRYYYNGWLRLRRNPNRNDGNPHSVYIQTDKLLEIRELALQQPWTNNGYSLDTFIYRVERAIREAGYTLDDEDCIRCMRPNRRGHTHLMDDGNEKWISES